MIKDLWYTTGDDTRRHTARHGRGLRWETGYRDPLSGQWRRAKFERRRDAEQFERDMAAVRRGDLDALAGGA